MLLCHGSYSVHVLVCIGMTVHMFICCRAYSAMVSLPRRRGLAILYGGDDRFESGVVGQIISVS